MFRALLMVAALALPMLAEAKDPRGTLIPRVYGSKLAQYDNWIYVPFLDVKGQVAGAQVMSPADEPTPNCSVAHTDQRSGEPVPVCYVHASVWCQGGSTKLMAIAPEQGPRFVDGKNSLVHWNLDRYIKGRWLNLYLMDDLSRVGQWEESSGEPEIERMLSAKNLSIELQLEGIDKKYYRFSLKGFRAALKKCVKATKDTADIRELLNLWD